jgi:aryl-alcohol dehydrogenase-like predicted oxidoreductase
LKIALGTAQFGLEYGISNSSGIVSEKEISNILSLCLSNGVDTIDTAVRYGCSETRIGECNLNNNFKVVTKVPAVPSIDFGIFAWLREEALASSKRLNSEPLYGLLLHRPEQLLDRLGNDIYKALRRLQDDGIVVKIGISAYDPDLIDLISSKFKIDIVQAPFNVFDTRMSDSGCFSRLKNVGVEVHARSIFLQGLLLLGANQIPSQFMRWSPIFQAWHKWLEETNVTALSACVSFALKASEIDRIIVGVESASQLQEIIDGIAANSNYLFPKFPILSDELINPSSWDFIV